MANSSISISATSLQNISTAEKPIVDTDTAVFTLITNLVTFLVRVPGNCLILRVHWTKIHKTSIKILIMAWTDISVYLLRLPRISVKGLELSGKNVLQAFDGVISAAGLSTNTASVLVTTVIAVDRYDCICRSKNNFLTEKQAKLIACLSLQLLSVFMPLYIPVLIS